MRKGREAEFGINENGVWAINLGADYCAEHEFGIKTLRDFFGITNEKITHKLGIIPTKTPIFGVESRTITKIPNALNYVEFTKDKKKWASIICQDRYGTEKWSGKNLPGNLMAYGSETIATAWSDRDFGVMVTGDENISKLKEVYEAFLRLDIAIYVGGRSVFKNGGLIIAIPSKMEENFKKEMYDFDESQHRLRLAVEKTGIKEKLEKAGKKYFALSPSWANEEQTEVKFWLNPQEQHKYSSNYCTVKDLEDWILEKGIVMKNK